MKHKEMCDHEKNQLTYEIITQAVELKRDGLCAANIIAVLDVYPSTFYL